MVDHEEWRLGDDAGGTVCPVCGKANRAGQVHCAFCGTPLDAESGSDPLALRTISEAMTGGRPARRRRRERPWMWPTAVVIVLVAAAGGFFRLEWLQNRPGGDTDETRRAAPTAPDAGATPAAALRVESKVEPPPPPRPPAVVAPPVAAPPVVAPRPVATAPRVVAPRPVVTAPPAAARPPVTAAIPPRPVVRATPVRVAEPPVVRTAAPRRATARPAHRAPPPAAEPEEQAAVPPAPVAAETPVPPRAASEPVATPAADAAERPSLGTDLVEAQRAYRTAIERYNARADEYNDVADQVQRGDGEADADRAAALHAKLDRARDAAERARADADALKAHLDAVQAKYR